MEHDRETTYWNRLADSWQARPPQALWRQYSDSWNAALVGRWLPNRFFERVLKTDLFDEAVSEGLYPALAARAAHVVGIDLSRTTALHARCRHPTLTAVTADARHLPFADECFDLILSNSTLDHFDATDSIAIALGELSRTLRPDGQLLLTMDNLDNPLIWLRNHLPASWLGRLGLIPYKMGCTTGVRGLHAMVRSAGLQVVRTSGVLHCPRVLAVAAARGLQRFTNARAIHAKFLRALAAFERLEGLPTRYVTGHFVALLARKPG